MSSIDPTTMAKQMATYDVKPFQDRYKTQADSYKTQLTELGKVEGKIRDFRKSVNDINSPTSSIIKNGASVSKEGFVTVDAKPKALSGNYQIFVESVASGHQLSVNLPTDIDPQTQIPTIGKLDLSVGDKSMSLDLASLDKQLTGKASLAQLISSINNASDNPGVNASLLRSNGQTYFMLTSADTGAASKISVKTSGVTQPWFNQAFANTQEISSPADAVVWLGAQNRGLKLTSETNTFTNAIDGVDITVEQAQQSGEAPLTLNIAPDEEATKTQIQGLVDAYNGLMKTIDTATQIGDGKDVKRGALANDPTLKSFESQINRVVRNKYDGHLLSELGITIDRTGSMQLDSNKFLEAQRNNSAAVEKLFNGNGALLDSVEKLLSPYLQFSNGLFKSRKDALQQNISRIEQKQTGLERKYDMVYNRYLKQFAQMDSLSKQMEKTKSMFA
ncbi:flagellar hook-associated protein 2 [Vibrio xiamenensis]|uniref:Flagellar hook-associated protein 2 n=1 Tax=Vibrio xiamenensis TaxID=861298 RepID=A0A1G7Y2G1_9VIBR|nr:flagellar filament capping protein FliD [Vibrio xiamenensis]SDG90446.1 flagellar hook-associated protein 2 [Vibrio xiamenensis]